MDLREKGALRDPTPRLPSRAARDSKTSFSNNAGSAPSPPTRRRFRRLFRLTETGRDDCWRATREENEEQDDDDWVVLRTDRACRSNTGWNEVTQRTELDKNKRRDNITALLRRVFVPRLSPWNDIAVVG